MKVLVAYACILIAIARLFVPHVNPSPAGTYEALAHVFCGILIGAALAKKEAFYWWALAAVSLVEVAAFIWLK